MPIRLPDKPTGKQYEDFVSACLSALGYFIETRIVLKPGKSQILELDVVATPSGDAFRDRMLVDAKSGDWGFKDVFKIYGWMNYLGIDRGLVAHLRPVDEDSQDGFQKIGADTDVRCCHLSTETENVAELAPACNDLTTEQQHTLTGCGWWQQIAQRLAYAQLVHKWKSEKGNELLAEVKAYYAVVQQSFFRKDPLERVYRLYEAYQEYPHISGKLIALEAARRACGEQTVWNELKNTEKHPWLQFAMLLEHKARLAVVKNALDRLVNQLDEEARGIKRGPNGWGKVLEALMPENFRAGIEHLATNPLCRRIPYLLQLFIELFGGFYFEDSEDDIKLLSELSGIPADEIVPSLRLMNEFFPFERDWFYTVKDTLVCMKMIPGFVRGTGCFLRQAFYDFKDYAQRYPNMGWLLAKWHNALYHLLEPDLRIEPSSEGPH